MPKASGKPRIRCEPPSTREDNIRLGWLLVLGVAFSPVTTIALGPLNPGEWLVLLWCILTILGWRRNTVIQLFDVVWWLLFLAAILLGTLVGNHATPHQTSIDQLLTWAYFCLVFITITTGLSYWSRCDVERL